LHDVVLIHWSVYSLLIGEMSSILDAGSLVMTRKIWIGPVKK